MERAAENFQIHGDRLKHKLSAYFKNCLYFTSGSLFRRMERMAAAIFSEIELAPIHAFVLMALAESKEETLTPSELADVLELDRSTVTRHLDALEKRGLIHKKKAGKLVHVTLAKSGKQLLPKIEKAWDDLYKSYGKEWGKSAADDLNDAIFQFLKRTTRES